MNINIRNEFNFSDVHGTMNGSGSLAKLTYFARDSLRFIEHQKNEIHFLNKHAIFDNIPSLELLKLCQ